MRRLRFRTSTTVALTVIWSMIASISPVHGQQPPDATPEKDELVTLKFEGGTLDEFVDLVNEKYVKPTNIAISPEIAELRFPPIEFKITTTYFPVTLLEAMAPGRLRIPPVADNMFYDLVMPPTVETRVFAVRDLISDDEGALQNEAMQLLISAIEATLDLSRQTVPRVEYKIHGETGLLLVVGTKDQTEIIEQIVTQLRVSGPLTKTQ